MKEKSQSCGRTKKNLYSTVNKKTSDNQRKPRISFRVEKDILQELDAQEGNRSEAIRKALKKEYGESDGL
jgi:hypothetical protein